MFSRATHRSSWSRLFITFLRNLNRHVFAQDDYRSGGLQPFFQLVKFRQAKHNFNNWLILTVINLLLHCYRISRHIVLGL